MDGAYVVTVMETKSGRILKNYTLNSKNQKISFVIPAFVGDVAFKAIRKVG
jgi:hypothetical protein